MSESRSCDLPVDSDQLRRWAARGPVTVSCPDMKKAAKNLGCALKKLDEQEAARERKHSA